MNGCKSRTDYIDRVVSPDDIEELKNKLSREGYEEIEVFLLAGEDAVPGTTLFRITAEREVCLCERRR